MKLNEFNLAATTNDLTNEAEAREFADMIEFRMDTATDPIKQLSKYDGDLPIIATNRGKWFGGGASEVGRLDRLFSAANFDAVEVVDIELEIARGSNWILDDFEKADVEVIISFHEFESTPNKEILDAIIEQSHQYGDIAKVATMAESSTDTINMLSAINDATESGIPVAGICMGEIGRHTRAVGPLYGSKLGYAPLVSDTNEYAPGQIPLQKLRMLMDELDEEKCATVMTAMNSEVLEPQISQSG